MGWCLSISYIDSVRCYSAGFYDFLQWSCCIWLYYLYIDSFFKKLSAFIELQSESFPMKLYILIVKELNQWTAQVCLRSQQMALFSGLSPFIGILFKHLCLTCGSQRCFWELSECGGPWYSVGSASAGLGWGLRPCTATPPGECRGCGSAEQLPGSQPVRAYFCVSPPMNECFSFPHSFTF